MALPLSLATLRVARPEVNLALRLEQFGVDSVRFGTTVIPVAEDGQMLINYRGPGRTFPHYSASKILAGEVPPEKLRGKIVLLGITAKAVQDIRVTPFDAVFPGVEIHANVIDNILHEQFIHQPKWLVLLDVGAICALAFVMGIAMRFLRGIAAAVMVALLIAADLIGTQWLFVTHGIPLTIVYALLAISVTYAAIAVEHYLTEERERRKMRKALELYLSPSMAHIVSEQPGKLKLGGDKRELTVFFSDIRGFTTISEGLAPEVLVELLNVYLGEMTDIIFRHDGMLDKYIGDAVMAVWGAPLPQNDHVPRACHAALQMVARLRELNEEWKPRGWPRIDIGAGLNTGPMVFGNLGSEQHLSLTVMGDNVNLGSRLEGLNKLYGTNIIAAEETVRAAGSEFVSRELDLVRVKGKNLPVRIFELLGTSNGSDQWASLIERFNAGLEAFREQRWEDAQETFAAVLKDRPTDGPARLYMARCQAMMATPPGPGWDGVTVMDTK
jgi:adenylate cyclase